MRSIWRGVRVAEGDEVHSLELGELPGKRGAAAAAADQSDAHGVVGTGPGGTVERRGKGGQSGQLDEPAAGWLQGGVHERWAVRVAWLLIRERRWGVIRGVGRIDPVRRDWPCARSRRRAARPIGAPPGARRRFLCRSAATCRRPPQAGLPAVSGTGAKSPPHGEAGLAHPMAATGRRSPGRARCPRSLHDQPA